MSLSTTCVFAHPLLSDAGIITGGNARANLPLANLQKSDLADRWQSSGLASLYLETDLGAAYAINFVGLFATNATPPPNSPATWRICAATSQANLTASPGYDSGTITMLNSADLANWTARDAWHFPSSAQTFRWWRIDITDAANPNGDFWAGRLYISAAWQASWGLDLGAEFQFDDASPVEESLGRKSHTEELPLVRTLRGAIRLHSESEIFDNAYDLLRRRSQGRDVAFVFDPTKTTQLHKLSMYCRFKPGGGPIQAPQRAWWDWQFEIEELIP